MAVHTHLVHAELCALLSAHYELADIVATHPIAEGIENTNYRIETGTTRYVFTIFEKRAAPENIPWYLKLTEHLHARGFSCPTPIHTKTNTVSFEFAGKQAALISFLEGSAITQAKVNEKHLASLGSTLAQLHHLSDSFQPTLPNQWGLKAWHALAESMKGNVNQIAPNTEKIVEKELEYLAMHWPHHLPRGVIHSDLFPDNVFFLGERVSGVIDFYFSCEEIRAYELAIVLNAWCFSSDWAWQATHAKAFLAQYHAHRALSKEERAMLPILLRGAALRFFLTRAQDWLSPATDALVTKKDPLEYLSKLTFHQHHAHDFETL